MISATGVGVCRRGRWLLRDVSVQVAPGEVLGLLGPNGAGKSTLLSVMAGDLTPTEGEVRLAGRPLRTLSRHALAQARAVLPQHSELTFSLAAREVVSLGRAPYDAQREREITMLAMGSTGVCHLAERDYGTLSGGERQRVQLARVLAQLWRPEPQPLGYLLLDEPTTGLDVRHQRDLLRVAHQVARRGAGVLLILHDINLAAQACHRVVLLEQGRVVAQGTPARALTAPTLEQVFELPVQVVAHPLAPRVIFNLTHEERAS